MSILLNAFVSLCLLRTKPQDISASNVLFVLVFSLSILTGIVGELVLGSFSVKAILYHVMDGILVSGFLWLGLSYSKKTDRFLQAATAILASRVFLNVLILPLFILIGDNTDPTPASNFALFIYFLMIPWGILIVAHVLRYTFDVSLGIGYLYSLVYFFFYLWIVEGLVA